MADFDVIILVVILVIGGVGSLVSIIDVQARASAWRRIAVERRRNSEQRMAQEGDRENGAYPD